MDWLACGLTLLSVELTARKLWYGWAVGLLSQAVYIMIGWRNGLWAMLPLSVILGARYIIAMRTWYRDQRRSVMSPRHD